MHEAADDAAGLLGEALAVSAGEGEGLLADGALDDEGGAVFDLDLGVLVHLVLGPSLDENDVAVLDVAGDGVLVSWVDVQAREVDSLVVELELGAARGLEVQLGHEGLAVSTGFGISRDGQEGLGIEQQVHGGAGWWLEVEAKWLLALGDNHEVWVTVGGTARVA